MRFNTEPYKLDTGVSLKYDNSGTIVELSSERMSKIYDEPIKSRRDEKK